MITISNIDYWKVVILSLLTGYMLAVIWYER